MSKIRLSQLEKRVREHVGKNGVGDIVPKFVDAYQRGMVLCKDGKERTVQDWLKTLDPQLAAQISQIVEKQDASEEKK